MTALAEELARRVHAGQIYEGHGDYADTHLRAVVAVLVAFGFDSDDWTAAGWLHDALEDTQLTYGALSNQLGKRVADLVWAVTGEGSDRKERNGSIYRKIMQNPEAATLKLADRIANVEASHGTRHMRKYADEIDEFRAAILDHVPREMWMRLERAFLPPV